LRVRRSQIVIQGQRPLALGHALGRAVRVNLHGAQHQVGTGMVRREGQCLYQRRLGHREMSAPVVGKVAKSNSRIDTRQTDHRADTSGIDGQGTFEKLARLRHVLGGRSLVHAGPTLKDQVRCIGMWRALRSSRLCYNELAT
jgi:hypothetical protein